MKTEIIHRDYPQDIAAKLAITPPVMSRIYAARGITSAEEIDLSLKNLLPFSELGDINKAAAIVIAAIEKSATITVIGDYDVDGATSAALTIRALKLFGAYNVDYIIPNRFNHGYGLSVPLIEELYPQSENDLIITVDNGITSYDGINLAKSRGFKVIVTDHHLPGERLPAADAIVNPNCNSSQFASKNLCGAGVAFYMMSAVRAQMRDDGYFRKKGIQTPNMAKFLDLVALATVADVVPLDRNNRILTSYGLNLIRKGECVAGISAILKVAGREASTIGSSDIGFVIGPRLNAAGRLDDMSLGVEILLEDNPYRAEDMAYKLDGFNSRRKNIESDMKKKALEELKTAYSKLIENPCSFCLYDENWHQGVIGILASRIKDSYNRPVAVFTESGDDKDSISGSVRSVDGLHIRNVLDKINKSSPNLISRYGGHSMAAGLSIKKTDLERFKNLFESHVGGIIANRDMTKKIITDGQLSAEEFSLDIAQSIRDGEPWGQHFPEPIFHGVFEIEEKTSINDKHTRFALRPKKCNFSVEAIIFNHNIDEFAGASEVVAVFQLTVNHYRGFTKLQLIIQHWEKG